jgi:AraC-like DNA-binding protein
VLADDPATAPMALQELMACHLPSKGHAPLTYGGGGEGVTLICGYVVFEPGTAHPLLSVLPQVVHVRGEAGRARSWLESTLDLVAEEAVSDRPGAETLINRLTEAMFIQVVRAHLEQQEAAEASWLAGLRDPQIATALGHIHRAPESAWSVDALAAESGMSRSAFSARFRDLVGEPPVAYLTRWRMQVAAGHLRESRLTLGEIAERVGYQTEASFGKVFKRLLGVAPATYRRQGSVPA